jgi:hypothetical protein
MCRNILLCALDFAIAAHRSGKALLTTRDDASSKSRKECEVRIAIPEALETYDCVSNMIVKTQLGMN